MFSDITYESARSITGPYLILLGAGGTVVGFIAGFGEFTGYVLRLFSGFLCDKTRGYWLFTIIGYLINLFAVPLLGLVNRWETACLLIILERAGKAIRSPARDTILSSATANLGRGLGFGLHEALDQIGAVLGPLIMAGILSFKEDYKLAFIVLFIPAMISIVILIVARFLYPRPIDMERTSVKLKGEKFSFIFWLYIIATGFISAGYVDFPLIAYHFKGTCGISDRLIPVFYSIAMGIDGIVAPLFGCLFDKKGISVFIFAVALSLPSVVLVYSGNILFAVMGMVLWGIGMGAQESIMRAMVSMVTPIDKRALGYGIFNTSYGLFWFIGSVIMGMLYDKAVYALVLFSVITQALSLPFLVCIKKKIMQQVV